ncbi:hypothetical protein [Ruminococcus sp.]|uniref:hypothetical protein n=1 Tax=Ruminococcus sp. TaxID=41978 RepID=UPI003967C052
MLTRDEIITVAKCCIVDTCESCPLVESGNCIINFMKHILEYMKTEPAPAATGTSSEVSKDTDNIHIDDSVKTQICQEAQKAYKACELILDIYERMEDEEQKAFDMGQSYRAMLEVKEELTRIGNGGDNNG